LNVAGTPQRKGSETRMEGKARFFFPVVITATIVFVRERAVTFFNIGWRNDFVIRWWSAFAIGWPMAAGAAYLAMPVARSLTQRIVAAVERAVGVVCLRPRPSDRSRCGSAWRAPTRWRCCAHSAHRRNWNILNRGDWRCRL